MRGTDGERRGSVRPRGRVLNHRDASTDSIIASSSRSRVADAASVIRPRGRRPHLRTPRGRLKHAALSPGELVADRPEVVLPWQRHQPDRLLRALDANRRAALEDGRDPVAGEGERVIAGLDVEDQLRVAGQHDGTGRQRVRRNRRHDDGLGARRQDRAADREGVGC